LLFSAAANLLAVIIGDQRLGEYRDELVEPGVRLVVVRARHHIDTANWPPVRGAASVGGAVLAEEGMLRVRQGVCRGFKPSRPASTNWTHEVLAAIALARKQS